MSCWHRKRLPLNQPEFTSRIVKMRPDNCEVNVTIIWSCNSLKERKYVEYTNPSMNLYPIQIRSG